MHIDEINKKLDAVIARCEKGESTDSDDRIIKSTGNMIRGMAVKIDYGRARGERPFVSDLEDKLKSVSKKAA